MGGWMCGWVDGWRDGWVGGCVGGWMDGLMEGCMDGWRDGWRAGCSLVWPHPVPWYRVWLCRKTRMDGQRNRGNRRMKN